MSLPFVLFQVSELERELSRLRESGKIQLMLSCLPIKNRLFKASFNFWIPHKHWLLNCRVRAPRRRRIEGSPDPGAQEGGRRNKRRKRMFAKRF